MAEIQTFGWRSLVATSMTLVLPAIAALPGIASPEPAELLPSNTAYTLLLDMQQETWDQLNQYALFQQLQAQGVGAPNPGPLPLMPELAYEDSVAPWVGETVAMALLPLDESAEAVFEDNEVMIAPITDPGAFSQIFQDGLPGAIADLKQRDPEVLNVEGVDIYYWPPLYAESEPPLPAPLPEDAPVDGPPTSHSQAKRHLSALSGVAADTDAAKLFLKAMPAETDSEESEQLWESLPLEPGLAIARFPDFLIAARTPAAIQAWLAHRPANVTDSLAHNEPFLRTLNHPQADVALGMLYGDIAELLNYATADLTFPDLPFNVPLPSDLLPTELSELTPAQLTGNIEALIYPQPRGLRLQARGYFSDAFLTAVAATTQPAPTDVLDHVPGDSFGMVSGHNIADFWQEVAIALAANEDTRPFLEQTRGFVTALTGLDLDEDVFGWMDQGFTVFLYPTRKTPLTSLAPELTIGLGIALQTSDRPTAEATFATLDDLMANFDIAVESTAIDGHPATGWGDRRLATDQLTTFWGRTWVADDTLLLTTSLEALADLTQLEPAQAIPNAFRFSVSTRDFPTANQGYLFVNTAPIRALVASFFPPSSAPNDPVDFRQFTALQALSGTVSFQDDYVQVDGLVMLAPAETR